MSSEIYKGFRITPASFKEFKNEEIWRPLQKPATVRAVLKSDAYRGRPTDVVFEGKVLEVKRSIREFWNKK